MQFKSWFLTLIFSSLVGKVCLCNTWRTYNGGARKGIRQVLSKFIEYNFQITALKSKFFKREIGYLGMLRNGEEIRTDPEIIKKILKYHEYHKATAGMAQASKLVHEAVTQIRKVHMV